MIIHKTSNFETGKVLQTSGINTATELPKFNFWIWNVIARHKEGDWGDLNEVDIKNNNTALEIGERILSAFNLPEGMKEELRREGLTQNSDKKIWIITERDRNHTIILFPSEY